MTKIIIPAHIADVLARLRASGFEAYPVGGCVRDSILGRPVHDWDIAASALPAEIMPLFTKTAATGVRFGGVTVVLPECAVEITAFRTDGPYLGARRPESVGFGVSLESDLSRRDFTMNAMAISESGGIIDPFGGRADIENRVIRCVGNPLQRFSEDALRMLRALRFSAELGFAIEPATMAAIAELAPLSRKLSAERVRDEVQKTLMSPRPEIMCDMIKLGLLAGRVNTSGIDGGLDKLARLQNLPPDEVLRWAAFCAVLRGARAIASVPDFLRELRLPNKMARLCSAGAELALSGFPDSRTGIKKQLSAHGDDTVRCAAEVSDALYGGGAVTNACEVLQSGECYSLDMLAVTGKDLIERGHPPDAALGATLDALLLRVIEYPWENTRDTLLKLAGSHKT